MGDREVELSKATAKERVDALDAGVDLVFPRMRGMDMPAPEVVQAYIQGIAAKQLPENEGFCENHYLGI